MLRTIRGMALAALAMQLVVGVSLYSQIAADSSSSLSSQPIPESPFISIVLPLLYVTSYLLAFALGVVTLVAAAQHRRRRWFVPLLPLTILVGYANILSSITDTIIYFYARPVGVFTQEPTPPIVLYIPLMILGLPVALALTALAYTGQRRAWSTALLGATRDAWESAEAEETVEVSSIDTPLDVTR